ncbi:MAG: aspartate ammonia-lyase [Eubacteriales bacterium]
MRTEKDFLGEKQIQDDVYWGIHTQRAIENFPISGQKVHHNLIKALAAVKISTAEANMELNFLDENTGFAIIEAGSEIIAGKLADEFPTDALQGGAGTSTNMNVNEVIANRASELLGSKKGEYLVHPLNHVNMHQSTNDTYPTALKIAAIKMLLPLSEQMAELQNALQEKEAEFAGIIKPGRTQLQDAVPITLGQEFSAWAQAISRDRWRLYKVEERLRQVNLGGTVCGTGINAPKEYIYLAIEKLRQNTGIGLARAENMIDATANADVFTEVSGLLKTTAVNLNKIANDLRLLSSGPYAGFSEINLPKMQAGSSIMPGKVNPVILEAINQIAFQVIACDLAITLACQNGQLEINQFLPLVAHNLLNSIDLLSNGATILTNKCIKGITANKNRCIELVEHSLITAPVLLAHLGYDKTAETIQLAQKENITIKKAVQILGYLSDEEASFILDYHRLAKPGIAKMPK